MSVTSVLRIALRPGLAGELIEAFERLEVFEHSRRSGGFRGARLLRPVDGSDHVVVVAEWDSAHAYQAWLDNPVRERIGAELEPLLAEDVPAGGLYEVVL